MFTFRNSFKRNQNDKKAESENLKIYATIQLFWSGTEKCKDGAI